MIQSLYVGLAVKEISFEPAGSFGGSENKTVGLLVRSGRLFGILLATGKRYVRFWCGFYGVVGVDPIG